MWRLEAALVPAQSTAALLSPQAHRACAKLCHERRAADTLRVRRACDNARLRVLVAHRAVDLDGVAQHVAVRVGEPDYTKLRLCMRYTERSALH